MEKGNTSRCYLFRSENLRKTTRGRGNTLREAASLRDAPRMRLHELPLPENKDLDQYFSGFGEKGKGKGFEFPFPHCPLTFPRPKERLLGLTGKY
jgi:hypothetical protein